AMIETETIDLEDLQFGVRRVHGQKEVFVRRYRERPHLTALKRRKVLAVWITIRKDITCVTYRQARDECPKYQIPDAACCELSLHSRSLHSKLTGTVHAYYFC